MQTRGNVTLIELKRLIKNGERVFSFPFNLFACFSRCFAKNLIFFPNRMSEKKREAEAAIDLMSVQYERNCLEEERRNGLLILSAVYGKIDDDVNSDDSSTSSNQIIDVKIPLQCLVKDSKLILQENGKVIVNCV